MSVPSAPAVPERARKRPPGQPGRGGTRAATGRHLAHRRLLLRRPLRRAAAAARHRAGGLRDLPRAEQFGRLRARTSSTPSTTTASCRRSSTSSSSWRSGWSARRSSSSGSSLMLHNLARRVGAVFRFLFYIPGALAGAASVIVWLFMLDPSGKPVRVHLALARLRAVRQHDRAGQPPRDLRDHGVLDRCRRVDRRHVRRAQQHSPRADRSRRRSTGRTRSRRRCKIKLPLIRKWIVYMLVLSFAGGTQLFVEPTVLGSAALGVGVSKYWSPNQLAWFLASQYDQFNEAAAISVVLLVFGLRRRRDPGLARKAVRGRVMALPRRYALRFIGLVDPVDLHGVLLRADASGCSSRRPRPTASSQPSRRSRSAA